MSLCLSFSGRLPCCSPLKIRGHLGALVGMRVGVSMVPEVSGNFPLPAVSFVGVEKLVIRDGFMRLIYSPAPSVAVIVGCASGASGYRDVDEAK